MQQSKGGREKQLLGRGVLREHDGDVHTWKAPGWRRRRKGKHRGQPTGSGRRQGEKNRRHAERQPVTVGGTTTRPPWRCGFAVRTGRGRPPRLPPQLPPPHHLVNARRSHLKQCMAVSHTASHCTYTRHTRGRGRREHMDGRGLRQPGGAYFH